jgi:platelet-activating factor acetylhydrolase IB subunit alpha
MDLETRNASLQEELSLAPSKRAAMQADWVPRAPAAHVLAGHRQSITRVAFHPQYSLLASASEDATVKIWDWETGEFERTLKGHQKGVNDVEFDHKGHLLGECEDYSYSPVEDSCLRSVFAREHSQLRARRICSSRYGILRMNGRTSRR